MIFFLFLLTNVVKKVMKGEEHILLSILIPSYMTDPTRLVHALLGQMPQETEIVVADDGSPDAKYGRLIASLKDEDKVRVILGKENIGRACIRNLLAREARGKYLLYLDADGMPLSGDFISRYTDHLPTDAVIVGSIAHEGHYSPHQRLRLRYELSAAKRLITTRLNRHPYQHFRTFNFLIPRNTMLSCPFDETLSIYEDVFLGKALEEKGVKCLHIDNPLNNEGVESNAVFLQKTLTQLQALKQKEASIRGYSSLISLSDQLGEWHLRWMMQLLFHLTEPLMRSILTSSHPSVWLYQMYKIGYYVNLSNTNQKQ